MNFLKKTLADWQADLLPNKFHLIIGTDGRLNSYFGVTVWGVKLSQNGVT